MIRNLVAFLFRLKTKRKEEFYYQLYKLKLDIETRRNDAILNKVIEQSTIFKAIEETDEFINAKSIAIYWSVNDEINTHLFLEKWKNKKHIYTPVIVKGEMFFLPYNRKYRSERPYSRSVQRDIEKNIDILILPGLAFDKQKYRVGRGGNFYNKYLKTSKFLKWGICFEFQMFENLAPEIHSGYKVDKVFTNETIYN